LITIFVVSIMKSVVVSLSQYNDTLVLSHLLRCAKKNKKGITFNNFLYQFWDAVLFYILILLLVLYYQPQYVI